MTPPDDGDALRIPLSRSQQNIYNGVLQDNDPALYLIGRRYRFHARAVSELMAALAATIQKNPVQLCVLETSSADAGYPDLVPRLQVDDLVRIREDDQSERSEVELERTWAAGILAKPLVRYTLRTDGSGQVCGLDVYTHHILLDGGATGIIETDLGHYLDAGGEAETPSVSEGLAKLTVAHRREATKIAESQGRLVDAVQRELADDARGGGYGRSSTDAPGSAAKGILSASVRISDDVYGAILALSDREQIPLNVLVAAAAAAVDASRRQSTESLMVHAVDNRFGEPDLAVATCLVNSVAQAVRFAPFASVRDVVRTLDKGYVKAGRRRWLREEHYRRMYLAINRASHVEAITLNFLREPCAPELRPFLSEVPITTDIGPIESMTVAGVLDEEQRMLTLAIWNRADLPDRNLDVMVGERIAAVLKSMTAMWDLPIAMTVDEWFVIDQDGARRPGNSATRPTRPAAPAWFLDPTADVRNIRERRRYVDPWISWLIEHGVVPGDVLVFTDDNTEKSIDLLIACHLAGCAYSICDTADQIALRASIVADHAADASLHVVDVAASRLAVDVDRELLDLIDKRIDLVARDAQLATKTAYIMPTSGSTGQPKLVPVTYGALAVFCDAVRIAYGWGSQDTILQCAPLTSDISVEEIFAGALCGAELIRSTAMKSGDLQALTRDLVSFSPTVLDLPTAVWHLLCDDNEALDAIGSSRLRQIVVGGEAIRPSAVDKWNHSVAAQRISLVSTYGPTETTVVVTYLPIAGDGTVAERKALRRLGRPIVPDTVFVAFGEVVVAGEMVSSGYLGLENPSFGTVMTADGTPRRAFATADRVTLDDEGFPVFAGRKDAVVKVAGKRVDTADVTARIAEYPAVIDVAVELHDGRLGVWFETQLTRDGVEDRAAEARIRSILVNTRVSSFFVLGVPSIPRKPNGKIDGARLRTTLEFAESVHEDPEAVEKAVGLAQIWSRQLGRAIQPDTSLLDAGVGSLDLIRILPDTRRHLGRQVLILDLISADTAANLVDDTSMLDTWMDVDTAAEIESDFAALRVKRPDTAVSVEPPLADVGRQSILVLGASGILGTGFASAVLEFKRSGAQCPDVVFAARSQLPEGEPWASLRHADGVRFERLEHGFGEPELRDLLRQTGATTLVNCIGSTNVVVPYRDLRLANVELVASMADVCAISGTRLVHLSTYVVNADVAAPRVTHPCNAPYPYAASKSLAELAVAGSPDDLDFTLVRLPRVLGEPEQMLGSADILAAMVDACDALRAYPVIELTEQVTTGQAAADAILRRLPEFGGSGELGRGITVVRGEAVVYMTLLSSFARDHLDVVEWKRQLDESHWAERNPRRWSVIDAWMSLGMILGGRSYAEYLSEYPTIEVGVESVVAVAAPPESLQSLLAYGVARLRECRR